MSFCRTEEKSKNNSCRDSYGIKSRPLLKKEKNASGQLVFARNNREQHGPAAGVRFTHHHVC